MSLERTYEPDGLDERLAAVRADDRQRRLVIAGGLLLGLGLGSLHWLGLVLGGALVALPARTFPRGLANGLGLGLAGLAVFGGLLAVQGALGAVLSTGMVGGVAVIVGLAAPLLGALLRGIG
ncbi:MAG: hypothetical protein U5J98_06440 [Halobacteriales archaeon]|nr:hypothetical protein [Halobacteriales archaeon]